MPSIKVIQQVSNTVTATDLVNATYGSSISLDGASSYSGQCSVTLTAYSTNTFVAANVNTSTDIVTITGHGYVTGVEVQLSSTGTLPAGLSTLTNYWIISLTANTLAFATTLALANAGTKVDITGTGSGGATHTITPTALNCNIQPQITNDPSELSTWSDWLPPVNAIATGVLYINSLVSPPGNFMRLKYVLNNVSVSSVNVHVVKGLD